MSDPSEASLSRGGEDRAVVTAARAGLHRRTLVLGILCGAALIAVPAIVSPAPRFVWNASASVETGLYLVEPGNDVRRGQTVLAWLPKGARDLADRRRYLPRSVPILKPVAAKAGDRVCAFGAVVRIMGRQTVRRLAVDRVGRPLPQWEGCISLGRDQLFLLAARRADSFDGRYFGPVDRRFVIGTARLVWAR